MAPFRQGLYVKQGSTSVLGSSVGKDTDREETAGEGHSGVDIVDSVVAGSVVEDTVVNVVVCDSVVGGSVKREDVDSDADKVDSVDAGSVIDDIVDNAAEVSFAGGVVVGDSVVRVSVVEDSARDVGVTITVGVWQSVPEKPSGQIQPSSPVLSSR